MIREHNDRLPYSVETLAQLSLQQLPPAAQQLPPATQLSNGRANEDSSQGEVTLHISDFPDSILLHIIQFLDVSSLCLGVRLVCVRWRTLSHDGSLWRYVPVPQHWTDARLVTLLTAVHDQIEELDLSTCENVSVEGLMSVAALPLPRLRHLELPVVNSFPMELFEKLAMVCPNMENVENIYAHADSCHPLKCQALFPGLKVLYDKPVSSYGRIRKTQPTEGLLKKQKWLVDLTSVAQACPKIHTYRCRRGLDYMDDVYAAHVSMLFPSLESIDFYYCSLTDSGIAAFMDAQCGKKETIHLDHAGAVTNEGLKIIVDSCKKLRSLKVSRCSCITNTGISYLSEHGHALRELHLHNMQITSSIEDMESNVIEQFNDAAVANIAQHCHDLDNFRLFYTRNVTMTGVECLRLGCPNLQWIMLYDCYNICDAALETLSKFRFLKALILVNCDLISARGVIDLVLSAPFLYRLHIFSKGENLMCEIEALAQETIAKIENTPTFKPNVLRKLALKGISGGFLQLLTVLCPQLHTLDLREGNPVGLLSLRTVLQNCEKLRVLEMQSTCKLDDRFLEAVAAHGMNVHKLGLGNMVRGMTTDGLIQMAQHCKSLSTLSMDIGQTPIEEDLLVDALKASHGSCFVHVHPECREPDTTDGHRFLDLHVTPLKYRHSVPARCDRAE